LLTISPNTHAQQAGLLVYQDDDNHIRITRGYMFSDNYVELVLEQSGSPTTQSMAVANTTVYLAISRRGTLYTGYYSLDGTTWTPVGQYSNVNFQQPKVGLSGWNGDLSAPEIYADFDFFHLTLMPSPYQPDPDTYRFPNADGFVTWDIFRDIFGPENVEHTVNDRTIRDPMAEEYFREHYECSTVPYLLGQCKGRIGIGGNCLGMSTSSLALWQGWTSFPIQGITQTIQLPAPPYRGWPLDAYQVWQDTSVADFIVRYQGYWYGREIQSSLIQGAARTLTATLNLITTSIDEGMTMPYVIGINGLTQGECRGHALTPYRYQQVGTSTQVYVYDSNHPYVTSQYIEINPSAKTWSYNHNNSNGIWQDDQCGGQGLIALPASLWQQRPTPQWIVSDFDYLAVSDNADLQITDEQGHVLGYRDGKLVSEIPNAVPVIPLGVLSDSVSSYIQAYAISGTLPVTVSMIYSDMGAAQFDIWGNNARATVAGVAATGHLTDTVRFDLLDQALQVMATGSTNERTLSFVKGVGNSSQEYTIRDFGLASGNLARLKVSPVGQVVTFTSSTAQGGYTVLMVQKGFTETGFLALAPAMQANDTHIISLDWSRPSTATVQIDHGSNGTIDEVVVLQNTYWRTYLPLVMRGY
jgi:hypothetical protein